MRTRRHVWDETSAPKIADFRAESLALKFRASVTLIPAALWALLTPGVRARVGRMTTAQARRQTTIDTADRLIAELDRLVQEYT